MVKFDWLTWWAGRQWGGGIIRMFTTSERAQRFAGRAAELNPWILRAAVVLAVLPGVPSAVVYATAGWARMRLATFLLLDLVGALLMTGLVAGLGYGLGQRAVDVVLLVVGGEPDDDRRGRGDSPDQAADPTEHMSCRPSPDQPRRRTR
jgi:membrane protein DedA with SNARE-associated domain